MKKIFFLAIQFVVSVSLFAQLKVIAESEPFEEPKEGLYKILQLKNGGTFFILIKPDGKVDIRIYDQAHTEVVHKELKPSFERLGAGEVGGVFETPTDITVLVSEREKTTKMYRVQFDKNSGDIKDYSLLSEMPRFDGMSDVSPAHYIPRKNKEFDSYAVMATQPYGKEFKRNDLLVYNGEHEEIIRTRLPAADKSLTYTEYVDMVFVSPEKVCFFAFGSNSRFLPKDGPLMMVTVEKGQDDEPEFKKLDIPAGINVEAGACRFNKVTGKIMLIVTGETWGKERAITPYLLIIDPNESKLDTAINLNLASEYTNELKKKYGADARFTGGPSNIFIEEDGSFTIVCEALSPKPGESKFTIGELYFSNFIGHTVVSKYDKNAKLLKSYFIPKAQYLVGGVSFRQYHAGYEGAGGSIVKDQQFKSFFFIPGKKKDFFLVNDLRENIKLAQEGKQPQTFKSANESEAFAFTIEGNEFFPAHQYIFNNAGQGKLYQPCFFMQSDYSPTHNVFATVRSRIEGRKRSATIVWLQPE